MSWGDQISKDFNLNSSKEVELAVLEVWCDEDTQSERHFIVNDKQNHTVTLPDSTQQECLASNFQFSLPNSSAEGVADLNISISDINKTIGAYIDRVVSLGHINIKTHFYLLSDLTTPQLDPAPIFVVNYVNQSVMQVDVRCGLFTPSKYPLSNLYYNKRTFPNLP